MNLNFLILVIPLKSQVKFPVLQALYTLHGWMDRWKDRWRDGWRDGLMERCTNGEMDEWMEGEMDR
jgi:hypothetical protein